MFKVNQMENFERISKLEIQDLLLKDNDKIEDTEKVLKILKIVDSSNYVQKIRLKTKKGCLTQFYNNLDLMIKSLK